MKKRKIARKSLKLLSGLVIGSAVGSILGLTLAPKKGKVTRDFLKKQAKSISDYKNNLFPEKKKIPLWKRIIVKLLTPKNKK